MTWALVLVVTSLAWISPGMREHEDEFRQAWLQRHGSAPTAGGGRVPPATYKAWYKQFKKTGIRPAEWIAAQAGGPPGSTNV